VEDPSYAGKGGVVKYQKGKVGARESSAAGRDHLDREKEKEQVLPNKKREGENGGKGGKTVTRFKGSTLRAWTILNGREKMRR